MERDYLAIYQEWLNSPLLNKEEKEELLSKKYCRQESTRNYHPR